jgi:7-cyano-7-deazaguanine synthase
MIKRGLVIFSGGQDSTTCLYWALKRFNEVHAITFNYGQNHNIELELSKEICRLEGVKQVIVDISFLNTIVESALINGGDINGKNSKDLPASFVPNRNQLFITLAHSYLQKLGGGDIVAGFCQTDYHGYPDCRDKWVDKIEKVSNLGSNSDINIITPLMFLDKVETFKLADDLGILDKIINLTNTCYNGNRNVLNEWGWGCGECPACLLRKEGFKKYKEKYG